MICNPIEVYKESPIAKRWHRDDTENDFSDIKDYVIARVIKVVTRYYKVTEDELKSKSRKSKFLEPRHVIMYLIRKLTRLSYELIGAIFNRDHSSVMHSCSKVINLFSVDKDFKEEIERLEVII